jgi:acyl-CoA dehydrogenase
MEPSAARDRLTRGVFISPDENDPIATLEAALRAVIAAEPVEAKLRTAAREGRVRAEFGDLAAERAQTEGIISGEEFETLMRARQLRRRVIMVDDFPQDLGRSELTQTTRPVTFEALRQLA